MNSKFPERIKLSVIEVYLEKLNVFDTDKSSEYKGRACLNPIL